MRTGKYRNCSNCGALVLKNAMADHWIIARHIHSALLPATAEPGDRQRYPEAYAPINALRSRRAS